MENDWTLACSRRWIMSLLKRGRLHFNLEGHNDGRVPQDGDLYQCKNDINPIR
jgi:hypothetical protein